MIGRFLIAVLIFLIAVLVAADRLGAIVAAHVLAGKVQTDEHLPNRPSASIGGFPFLTQAISGTYSDITIKATDVPISGVTVTSLSARLHGVHVPLSKLVHGTVSQVPVDQIDATALVSFADFNTYLRSHHPAGQVIFIRPGPDGHAIIVDRLRVGAGTASLRGVGTTSLSGTTLHVRVSDLARAAAGGVAVTSRVLRQAARLLTISVPLRGLPFQITLKSVSVTSVGVSVVGGARNVVLGS